MTLHHPALEVKGVGLINSFPNSEESFTVRRPGNYFLKSSVPEMANQYLALLVFRVEQRF